MTAHCEKQKHSITLITMKTSEISVIRGCNRIEHNRHCFRHTFGLSNVYMLHTGERLWARDYPFYPSFKDNPFPYLIISSKEFYQTGKT